MSVSVEKSDEWEALVVWKGEPRRLRHNDKKSLYITLENIRYHEGVFLKEIHHNGNMLSEGEVIALKSEAFHETHNPFTKD